MSSYHFTIGYVIHVTVTATSRQIPHWLFFGICIAITGFQAFCFWQLATQLYDHLGTRDIELPAYTGAEYCWRMQQLAE